MDLIHLVSKFIHILCGILVLIIGLWQMIMPKKGKLHRTAGKVYFALMIVIFFTALPPAIYSGNWFLASVSIFSLFLVWTGQRYGNNKAKGQGSLPDKWITIFGFLSSIFLFIITVLFLLKGNGWFSLVPFVFGLLLFLGSFEDYKYHFLKLNAKRFGNMHWYFMHFTRMIGSYIAATTAFLVNVQLLGDGWYVWLAPTLAGTLFIVILTRYYRKKFNLI